MGTERELLKGTFITLSSLCYGIVLATYNRINNNIYGQSTGMLETPT